MGGGDALLSFDNILLPLESLEEYKDLIGSFEVANEVISIHGISDAQKSMITAALSKKTQKSCIVITHNDILARKIHEDISFFDTEVSVLLPSSEVIFHKIDAKSNDDRISRIKALSRIGDRDRLIICTSVEALLPKNGRAGFFLF